MKNEHLEKMFMRDSFISTLREIAKKDKKIILLTNDQGAPALDRFIEELPGQFFNAGISEQNIIATASGLSLAGFKPYIYSINSFIIYRTIEYLKIDLCSMRQPVKIFGVGSGYSYPEDGPTHHSTEDIALTRVMANLDIFNPSDSIMTSRIVKYINSSSRPTFVRLDRQFCQNQKYNNYEIEDGFRISTFSNSKTTNCIISTGHFLQKLHHIIKKQDKKIHLIDFFRLKNFNNKKLINRLQMYRNIISIEEHSKNFGLGSMISELITDNGLKLNLVRHGLDEKHIFSYGSRDQLLHQNKLGDIDLEKSILKNFK